MVRWRRWATWALVAVLAAGPIPQQAFAHGIGSIGGLHIGGLGGLGGLHMGGMHFGSIGGIKGFSGMGRLPSGGFGSIGRMPSGSFGRLPSGGMGRMPSGSGMRALSSAGSMRGLSNVERLGAGGSNTSFAMRHLGGANLGRTGALTGANSAAFRSTSGKLSGGTFLASHAVGSGNVKAITGATKASAANPAWVSVRQVGFNTANGALPPAATNFSYRAGLAGAQFPPGTVHVAVNTPIVNAAGKHLSFGTYLGLTTWDQLLSNLGVSGILTPRGYNFGQNLLFYPFYPYFRGYWGYGYGPGYGFGYGPGCSCGPTGYSAYQQYPIANNVNAANNGAPPTDPTVATQSPTDLKEEFVLQGENNFRAGNYEAAVRDWRHALLDNPDRRGIALMLAQALFATGQYDEAAGAVQYAMQSLPADKWGVVVANYTELYRTSGDYANQLSALESAAEKKETDTPAVRFLLGYHYGYLGYPKQAVRELGKALAAAPGDGLARQLQKMMGEKLPPDGSSKPGPASK